MRTSIICATLLLAFSTLGGELRLSGVIGQSQPSGSEPLTSIGMRGACFDSAGGLWSFSDDGLLRRFVRKDASWLIDRSLKPPSPIGIGSLQKVGNSIVYAGTDGGVNAFDPATASFAKVAALPKGTISFHALDDGLQFKYIALAGNSVMASKSGKAGDWTELFKLAPPKNGRLYSIGIEPSGGEIIVGSSYSDMKVRRYGWDGKEHVSANWPKTWVHSEQIVFAGGIAWAITNEAISLSASKDMKMGGEWTARANGLACADDGSWWLSTAQGILGYDSKLKPLGMRIGGMAGPSLLATATDGTIIAYDSGRMLRFMIDDGPSSPAQCTPNEPFRAGGNWRSGAKAMLFDGTRFIVLDDKTKRLWAFDPWHTGYREAPWQALTDENVFKKPDALALVNGGVLVSDNGELLFRKHADEGPFSKLAIEAKGPMAASKDGKLFIVSGGKILAYAINPDGACEELWSKESGSFDIAAIAAGESFLVAIEPFAGRISAFSTTDGSQCASLTAQDIPGGMEPCSICISEPWVFVGDKAGKRILRLRLK